MVLFLLHITLTKTALAFFTCSDPLSYTDPLTNEIHEHRFLSADARIECYTGSHFMWAMTLGLGMLVVYALGIPLFAFLVLRNIKHDLTKWQATYGFLYSAVSFAASEPFIVGNSLNIFGHVFLICAVRAGPLVLGGLRRAP